jgi:hypothetical protein
MQRRLPGRMCYNSAVSHCIQQGFTCLSAASVAFESSAIDFLTEGLSKTEEQTHFS